LWQANIARGHAAAAQREATKAKVVQGFLLDLFRANSVEQRDPLKAQQTTARELLDIGSRRLAEGLRDSPDAQHEVLGTLADMYYQLGLTGEAARQHAHRVEVVKRAYGASDRRVADALLSYAEAILDSSERERILPVLDEAKRVLDANGDAASESRGRMLTLYASAHGYTSIGEARRYADEAVAFFKAHYPDTIKVPLALQVAARGRALLGDMEAAQALYREALSEVRRREAAPSAYEVVPLVGVAQVHTALGDIEAAERAYREALATALAVYGEFHGETIQSEVKLGAFLHATARRDEGNRLMERATGKLAPGSGHDVPAFVVAVTSGIRGARMLAEGRLDEAERLIDVDIVDARANYPSSFPLATALRFRAALRSAQGRYDEALADIDEATAMWRRIAGTAADPAMANAFMLDRARILVARGDAAAALDTLRGVSPPRYAPKMPLARDDVQAQIVAAAAHLREGRVADAITAAGSALQAVEGSPTRVHHAHLEAEALLRLGEAQRRAGEFPPARASLERALQLRERLDAPSSPWLAQAQLALAACLDEQGERTQAAALVAGARAIHAAHPRLGKHLLMDAVQARASGAK
jgi:serine/threonine-protein kinase